MKTKGRMHNVWLNNDYDLTELGGINYKLDDGRTLNFKSAEALYQGLKYPTFSNLETFSKLEGNTYTDKQGQYNGGLLTRHGSEIKTIDGFDNKAVMREVMLLKFSIPQLAKQLTDYVKDGGTFLASNPKYQWTLDVIKEIAPTIQEKLDNGEIVLETLTTYDVEVYDTDGEYIDGYELNCKDNQELLTKCNEISDMYDFDVELEVCNSETGEPVDLSELQTKTEQDTEGEQQEFEDFKVE